MSRRALPALLCLGLIFWLAAPAHAGIYKLPPVWHTCDPRQTLYTGGFRVDNDLFAGSPGRSCITSTTGHNLRIDTDYAATRTGAVTAYPDIRTGSFYASRDRDEMLLPMRVSRPHAATLHLTAKGRAAGRWLADADLWFYDNPAIRGHGVAELVFATRYTTRPACTRTFTIQRLTVCGNEHQTGSGRDTWPLIVLRLVRQQTRTSIGLRSLLRAVTRAGWLPGRLWLGSIAYGAEVWQGGRGLTLTLKVNR